MESLVMKFKDISINDVARVGGKNASLGELFNQLADKKVAIPPGFATTAKAFWLFIDGNQLRDKLNDLLGFLDREEYSNLGYIGKQARSIIENASLPDKLANAIISEYKNLCG